MHIEAGEGGRPDVQVELQVWDGDVASIFGRDIDEELCGEILRAVEAGRARGVQQGGVFTGHGVFNKSSGDRDNNASH